MTAIELKSLLIRQIAEINDISYLKAIKTILDSKKEKEILILTDVQMEEIMASKKEIEQGLFIENDRLEKEMEGWLSAK
jgi:hypothetical protein